VFSPRQHRVPLDRCVRPVRAARLSHARSTLRLADQATANGAATASGSEYDQSRGIACATPLRCSMRASGSQLRTFADARQVLSHSARNIPERLSGGPERAAPISAADRDRLKVQDVVRRAIYLPDRARQCRHIERGVALNTICGRRYAPSWVSQAVSSRDSGCSMS
jgi:hypothetical protein